jgi:hypothetical protein
MGVEALRMRGIPQAVMFGLVLAGMLGCGSGRTISGGAPAGGETGTVDFASQIQPIFDENCALSGCHASDTASGGMVLDAGQSYANLVNVESSEVGPDKRVVPGSSATSYIIEKLTSSQPRVGAQMPFGATPLPADQIALIRNWIDQGAHR